MEGRLQTRERESKGSTSRRTEILASRVQFLGAPPRDAVTEDISAEASAAAEEEIPFWTSEGEAPASPRHKGLRLTHRQSTEGILQPERINP